MSDDGLKGTMVDNGMHVECRRCKALVRHACPVNGVGDRHEQEVESLFDVNGWQTEAESCADFDRRIALCLEKEIFASMFKEVRGYYLAHRPGREHQNAKIDRILIPGPALIDRGWQRTIGVELKKSNYKIGAAVSQAIDYTYCAFNVGRYWMHCERIFLWPFAMPNGPLQSVMIQNGVGCVHGVRYEQRYQRRDGWRPDLLTFQLERNVIVIDSDGRLDVVEDTASGKKVGSR